jgi:acyl-CoA dehydrogenase
MKTILEDSIKRILTDQVNTHTLQESEQGQWLGQLWTLLEENGLPLAMVKEEHGGVGLQWSDVYPIIFNAGKYALPLPLPESILANWLLSIHNIEIPEGLTTIAEFQNSDRLTHTPWGRFSQHIVTEILVNNVSHLAVFKRKSNQVEEHQNLAREARDHLEIKNLELVHQVPAITPLKPGFIRLYGAMLRAAQSAGAIEQLLEQSVQYASERVQFGKPISKFQAIQQQIAVLGCESAAVASSAAFAFEVATTNQAELAIAASKIRCAQSSGKSSSIAHAVHGAMGFTYEHTLHYSSRRLWSWRSEFGNLQWWSHRVGESVLESSEDFWHIITSGKLSLNLSSHH